MPTYDGLLPAADDTASRVLVDIQTATTLVKEIVTECVANGTSEAETTQRLNDTIALACKNVDGGLKEQMRRALVTAARKWHYELKQTYKVLDNNLRRQAQYQPLDININDLLRRSPFQRNVEMRKILDDGTSPGVPIIRDYQRSVKIALKAMAAEPAKVVTRANNKTYVMPLRNRAEMAVRYDANVKSVSELLSRGIKFAWTSSHPNCSPRCKDLQGRLWSLEGKEGWLDGIHYDPIDKALKGKNGDGNGIISGYNCRHRLIAYAPGSRPPEDFSEAEITREYAIDRQQRSYENRIRQMKTEERQLRAAGGYEKEASELRKKWRRLTLDYEIYSSEHDRAFYRYRCVIDRDEIDGLDPTTGELSPEVRQKLDNKYGTIPVVPKENPMMRVLSQDFALKSREIVMTKRQYDTHIKAGANHHGDIYDRVKNRLSDILTAPDYVFQDEKHADTVIFVSKADAAQVVVKLNTVSSKQSNTILTIFGCGQNTLLRMQKKKKQLYKKDEE